MDWQFLVALMVAVPVVLFPAALVWYVNGGDLYHSMKAKLARRIVTHRHGGADPARKDAPG
jgi:hypothetical protein